MILKINYINLFTKFKKWCMINKNIKRRKYMSKRITLNPYFMDEKTMTPEQYLEKLKQEALDKEFDELAKENNKRIAEEQLKQEKQEELKLLMRTLWDCEDELYIAEELYKNLSVIINGLFFLLLLKVKVEIIYNKNKELK